MSLSVDDLVASLSASHIGQEATDLAALQVYILFICPAQVLITPALSPGPARADSPYPPVVPLTLSPPHVCLCARG